MNLPSDYEQLLLEYVNALRANPALAVDLVLNGGSRSERQAIDHALSYFKVDTKAFIAQMQGIEAQAPLAWNGNLATAAEGHSNLMIAQDRQGHLLSGEKSLGDRVTQAGYEGWRRVGENVYAYGESMLHTHAGFLIDWGYDAEDYDAFGNLRSDWRTRGDGIQDPAGHRDLLLADRFTEIGISVVADSNPLTSVGPFVVTQNLGMRKLYEAQLMGVVFSDEDKDLFYDMGEGMGGVTVTAQSAAGTFTTTTWASGGYQMVLAEGSYQLTFSGGGLKGVVTQQITMGEDNLKVDALADQAIIPKPPQAMPPNDHGLPYGTGLSSTPGNLVIEGTSGGQLLQGHLGNDILYGDGFGTQHRLAEQWASSAQAPAAMGQIYRIYQATLGRGPDPEGQMNWTRAYLGGTHSLDDVVAGFTGSNEFQNRYGLLSDVDFVKLLYKNVLGRNPDAGGFKTWTNALDSGMSREKVVLGFANSKEFIQLTDPIVKDLAGKSDPATWSDAVYRLYHAVLDRVPDADGFESWTKQLAGGMSAEKAANAFLSSAEFTNRYGDLDNKTLITQLHQNVFDREPDASSLKTWMNMLEGGFTLGRIAWELVQKTEFIEASAFDLKTWMRAMGGGDTLIGGGGDDKLYGGFGSDTFVFHAEGDGKKLIYDFEAWDHVALQGFGYDDMSQISDHLRQSGSDIIFNDQGVEITFKDTLLSTLTADVFLI